MIYTDRELLEKRDFKINRTEYALNSKEVYTHTRKLSYTYNRSSRLKLGII